MRSIIYFIAVIGLIMVSVTSVAQVKMTADSTGGIAAKDKSYAQVGIAYNSDIVFLGRKSSIKSPYVSASAGYYHKSGFFITGIISYLAAAGEKRIDLFTASGGYDYYRENFAAGISATGYVFNSKSYTAKSALKAKINGYADYDFDILEIYLDGTVYFSNQSDYIFSATVSHNFYAINDNLVISPSFSLYGGTRNYYSNYDNNLRFGRHMTNNGSMFSMGGGMMPGGTFNILDYEFSIPVKYSLNRFQFNFFPAFAIPVNAATITDNQNTYKEDLSNSFYWLLGVNYNIFKQKK